MRVNIQWTTSNVGRCHINIRPTARDELHSVITVRLRQCANLASYKVAAATKVAVSLLVADVVPSDDVWRSLAPTSMRQARPSPPHVLPLWDESSPGHIKDGDESSAHRQYYGLCGTTCAISTVAEAELLVSLRTLLHITRFYPNVMFRPLLSQIRLSVICRLSVVCLSVTLVHPTQRVKAFSNISPPLCILAILWPLRKILRRSS